MPLSNEDLNLENAIKGPVDNNVSVPANLIEVVSVTRQEETTDDEICAAIREDGVAENILKAVLWGFAEEQCSLKKLRQDRCKDSNGKAVDTSHISVKRGTLLKYMSETLLQRQSLTGAMSDLDLRGPKFREVFKMLLGIISETFDELKIPAEYKEMFFHALKTNLEGWEERAEKVIKAMTPKIL